MHIRPEIAHLAVPIDTLIPYARNPRRGNVDAIAESLRLHGQYRPVIYRRGTNEVLAGNHTLKAALHLGWTELAATPVDADDAEAAAIVLVDNRTNDLASYDQQDLVDLLSERADLAGTGYDQKALDALVAALAMPTRASLLGDPDDVPGVPTTPTTKPGDVWLLGPHRLICGDCRDHATVRRLLDGARINVAITSPPYAAQRTYDSSSGFVPIPPDQYVAWYEAVADCIQAHLADDGSYFLNIKEHCEEGERVLYVKDLTVAHKRAWGWLFVDEFCWQRPAPPGAWPNRFKNNWEPIFHFARSPALKFRPQSVMHASDGVPLHTSSVGARTDASNGTYWNLPKSRESGMALPSNVIAAHGVESNTGHVAAYPVALPSFFIRAFSDVGDTIYDPFMGSGTTLIAAEHEGRVAYGCEISPAYCDVICERFQRATSIEPIRETRHE